METKCPLCSSGEFCLIHTDRFDKDIKIDPTRLETNDLLCLKCGHIFGNPYDRAEW